MSRGRRDRGTWSPNGSYSAGAVRERGNLPARACKVYLLLHRFIFRNRRLGENRAAQRAHSVVRLACSRGATVSLPSPAPLSAPTVRSVARNVSASGGQIPSARAYPIRLFRGGCRRAVDCWSRSVVVPLRVSLANSAWSGRIPNCISRTAESKAGAQDC